MPQKWKIAQIITLSKSNKLPLYVSNTYLIYCLSILSKVLEEICTSSLCLFRHVHFWTDLFKPVHTWRLRHILLKITLTLNSSAMDLKHPHSCVSESTWQKRHKRFFILGTEVWTVGYHYCTPFVLMIFLSCWMQQKWQCLLITTTLSAQLIGKFQF